MVTEKSFEGKMQRIKDAEFAKKFEPGGEFGPEKYTCSCGNQARKTYPVAYGIMAECADRDCKGQFYESEPS